jgi:hypothetical protein
MMVFRETKSKVWGVFGNVTVPVSARDSGLDVSLTLSASRSDSFRLGSVDVS